MINTMLNSDKIIFVNYRSGANIELDINRNQKALDEVNLNDLNNDNFFKVPIYNNKNASLFIGIDFLNKLLDNKDLSGIKYGSDTLFNKNTEDFFYLIYFAIKTSDFIESVPDEYKLKVKRYLRHKKILSYNYLLSLNEDENDRYTYSGMLVQKYGKNFFTKIKKEKENLIASLDETERLYLELRGEV